MRPRRRQHRGSMYVALLMIAMIVTVIGLSGLTATRVQFRSAQGASDVAAARFYAQSAVEMGVFSIKADSSWRTTYSNDVWVPEQSIGNGSYTWKLVDEQDGDLADDSTQPVRLHGKGVAADAVRMYSVILRQPDTDPSNLLSNPGMENGPSDWSGYDCSLSANPADQHGGVRSLAVTDRDDYWAGPYQDVTSKIEIGTAYEIEAWAKMSTGSSPVRIVMWVGRQWPWEGFGGQWLVGGDTWVGDGEWTQVSATLTPTWTGDLNAAFVKISTSSGATDFSTDDAVLRVAGTGPTIAPVAGSWRRDVD